MLTINIHNDGTGDEKTGNYDYQVRVNQEVIAEGRIEKHNRKAGWMALVYSMYLKEMISKYDYKEK